MPICPYVWDLRKLGRDVEHSDFEMKAVKIGFPASLRSPVPLPLYLDYLILSASDSQHITNTFHFPYRHLELPSFFWKEKMAVAIEISHGRYWEKLESVTLTSDPSLP